MYTLSVNIWFQKLMKQFFFGIDQVVYGAISWIYDLLISITRTSVLSQADILDMADRIYKLLAIFMIFKVTLSLITYVVNPDDFSDKSKGISKLVTNIVISLGLLILTPYIFNMAYRLQAIILEDNTLATLIFDDNDGADAGDFFNSAGDKMSFLTLKAFFTPNTAIPELQNCINLTIEENGETKVNPECSGISTDGKYTVLGKSNSMSGILEDEGDVITKNYVLGMNEQNIGLMFRNDLVVATYNDVFVMNYKYIFSTVVGVVVVLLLISFCMDVALRSIKLSFLQLIAPIPILSYIDPKSGKDGMFKKWYQLCFKTFLSLFIRLLALYFAIYIISKVADLQLVDIVDGTIITHPIIAILVIIGALMFAKDLPKILEGLGIKLDGGGKFTLNPLKKFEESTVGGKNITGMARGAMVGTAGALSGAGWGRGLSGAWRGLTSGKGWKETGKAEAEMNRKMRQASLDGSTFGGRLGARFAGATGFRSESENIAREKNKIDTDQKKFDNDIKSIEDRIAPTRRKIADQKKFSEAVSSMENRAKTEIQNGNSWVGEEYKVRKKNEEAMSNNIGKEVRKDWTQRDVDYAEYRIKKAQKEKEIALKEKDTNAYERAVKREEEAQRRKDEAESKLNSSENIIVSNEDAAWASSMADDWLNDEGMKNYLTDASTGIIDDATFRNSRATAEKAGTTIGVELSNDGGTIHSQYGASKGATGDLEREIYDDEQRIEAIKLDKAKLGDEMRDIELRERRAKANESAIK